MDGILPGVPGRADVTLAGWQTEPQLRWSFQHVSDLFPTATIPAAPTPCPLVPAEAGEWVDDVALLHPHSGRPLSVGQVIAETDTDGWALAREGHLLREAYPAGMQPDTRHLLMSVSKSLVGVVAGALSDRGLLDVEAPVVDYVPELSGTGYDGATVRHLLDMRSGISFSEDYLDPHAEVRLLEQAIGWAPRTRPDVPDSLYGFLATLGRAREHGGAFEYRSCETDVLGWVCERAGRRRMAALLTELVWTPIGAEFAADLAVDATGAGMYDGGISASLRDLLRFGSAFLGDGTAWSGHRVLSTAWVDRTLAGDEDSASAFAASSDAAWMPGGQYRHQVWFPSARRDVLVCLGIHGQMVYVNRSAGLVAAKLSSWPTPQNADRLFATLAAFDAVAVALG